MDELTIADQKYLSSKKAAQITGYAKDYVGQLCREGRVEARLVGRNWYVLESSILEHRFGATEEEAEPVAEKPAFDTTWNSPVYKAEPATSLPEFNVPAVTPVQEPEKVLTDMQSAWQEWFKTQEKAEKMLPDASEMLLPEGDEDATTPTPTPEIPPVAEEQEVSEEDQEVIHVSRVHEAPEPVAAPAPQQLDSVVIRRDRVATTPQYVERAPRVAPRASSRPPQAQRRPQPRRQGSFALQAFLLSVAGLVIAVTLLASGLAERFIPANAISNPVTDFLSGVSTIESTK